MGNGGRAVGVLAKKKERGQILTRHRGTRGGWETFVGARVLGRLADSGEESMVSYSIVEANVRSLGLHNTYRGR